MYFFKDYTIWIFFFHFYYMMGQYKKFKGFNCKITMSSTTKLKYALHIFFDI